MGASFVWSFTNFALKAPAELFLDPFLSTDQPQSQHYHYKIQHFIEHVCLILLNGPEVVHMGSGRHVLILDTDVLNKTCPGRHFLI